MLNIAAFLVVIGVLVFVHELGHLLAAKAVDIEVPRFSIGFGPRVTGFQWGETEYVISALPLGGYVRMAGMEELEGIEGGSDDEPLEERVPGPRDFDSKPLWARAIVISAGVIMNFIFAVVVFAGIAFFYGEPINPVTRVEVTNADQLTGVAAPLATIPVGAELSAVNDRPVESWNEVQDALAAAPAGELTLSFESADPVTLDLPAADSERVAALQPLDPFFEPVIGQVVSGSPADEADIQSGDRVVRAAGQDVRSWGDLVVIIRDHPDEALVLEIQRDGRPLQVSVTPEAETELNAELERVEIGKLGVGQLVELEHRPVGLGEAAVHGVVVSWTTSAMIVELVGDLFTGEASPRSLGGPLAIGQLSGQAARFGLDSFFTFMALLSINLAVLNLLPIPILDGGQLLFIGLEAVRGRPLSLEQRLRMSHVGLIIVVGIMVWAMTNDVLRFLGI
ncbi:MAG TPA: RIP metalloprotease RseP [Longimicrobiaceae bacterium]|nr:RIP metalloprotease RseP [Longimicrobiaceae bacterium]